MAQVPFSSINYGTDTSPEGRLIIEMILKALEAGLGRSELAIFPIHIFKTKEGVNYNPTDPNYDLFKLAMKVASTRIYPNFSFLDAPFNLQFYKPNEPASEVAYMGCVDGDELITYKIDDVLYVGGIGKAYSDIKNLYGEQTYGISKYVDTTKHSVQIYDSNAKAFVQVKKFIQNPNKNNWMQIQLSSGHSLKATADHPLPIAGKGRTFVKDLVIGDVIPLADNQTEKCSDIIAIMPVECNDLSYDVETESDMFDVSGIQSHNCRTRVIANVHDPEQQTVYGRGNLSFTTINLPRLALDSTKAKQILDNHPEVNQAIDPVKGFFARLDTVMDLAIDQMLARYKILASKKVKNFPFLMGQGVWLDSDKLGPEDNIGEILKHGTLSLGFIGLAEALTCLTGFHHGESPESQKLGLKIVKAMRDKCDAESQKYKMNITLLATPAEGLCSRFTKLDSERYGVIPGVTDKEYYTNSNHIPVGFDISIGNKIKLEAPYHALTNAGHITTVEIDSGISQNLEAFESIIRCMKESGIGYGGVNYPVDSDPVCGFTGVIKTGICPSCGRDEAADYVDERGNNKGVISFVRIARVTGYLADAAKRFNDGKRAELRDRVKHASVDAAESKTATVTSG